LFRLYRRCWLKLWRRDRVAALSLPTKKLLVFLVVLGVVLLVVLQGSVRGQLLGLIATVQNMGPVGALLFALIYVVATVAVLPASLLTIAAGLLYGPYWAALLVLFASVSGATLAFTLARTWLHPWVESRFADTSAFRVILKRTERDGAKLVFLLRLSPLIPFSILNYLLGLTNVSVGGYVLASALGMVPGILLYTYIGSTLASLGELGSDGASGGQLGSVFFWVGLAATLAVTIVLTRWAAGALRNEA